MRNIDGYLLYRNNINFRYKEVLLYLSENGTTYYDQLPKPLLQLLLRVVQQRTIVIVTKSYRKYSTNGIV